MHSDVDPLIARIEFLFKSYHNWRGSVWLSSHRQLRRTIDKKRFAAAERLRQAAQLRTQHNHLTKAPHKGGARKLSHSAWPNSCTCRRLSLI